MVATPKHFAANFVGDGGRDSHPVYFSQRLLREIAVQSAAYRLAMEPLLTNGAWFRTCRIWAPVMFPTTVALPKGRMVNMSP